MPSDISRRDVLKGLMVGVSGGAMLHTMPLQAAQQVHRMVMEERAQAAGGDYTPKFFTAHSYQTLRSLCQTIIPPDGEVGGALEAGAPEFIDLLGSENQEYQLILGGGIAWLDSTCNDRYGKLFLECAPAQQKEVLDQIAAATHAKWRTVYLLSVPRELSQAEQDARQEQQCTGQVARQEVVVDKAPTLDAVLPADVEVLVPDFGELLET